MFIYIKKKITNRHASKTCPLKMVLQTFNPFPHEKILDHTKLKAFADDKLNVTIIIFFGFDRVENIV